MPNDLAAFTPELWATPVLERFRQINLGIAVACNTNYQGVIEAQGDTVRVRTTSNVTLRPYGRGGTVEYEDLNPTEESLAIDQSDYGAITVDDLDRAQNDLDALGLYTGELGVAIAEKMDSFAFGFHAQAHTSNRISASGSALDLQSAAAGATHPYQILVTAGKNLTERNVPMRGRWAIITPYFHSLLQTDLTYFIKGSDLGDVLLTSATVGGQALSATDAAERGFVGRAANFDLYVSNALPGDGAGNKYSLYGQGRPIALASQIRSFEALRLERTFGSAVRALLLYGAKVFAEPSKALGRIYHDES